MLLKSDELWQVMPARALTQRTSCLPFRMLSRIGCAAQEPLSARHEQLPTKLRALLTRPGSEDDVGSVPPCTRGSCGMVLCRTATTLASLRMDGVKADGCGVVGPSIGPAGLNARVRCGIGHPRRAVWASHSGGAPAVCTKRFHGCADGVDPTRQCSRCFSRPFTRGTAESLRIW